MKKLSCLILIDDSVFLQHFVGLIVMLCDKGFKPSLLLDNSVDKELVAYQLIMAMYKNNELDIVSLKKEDYSKTILTFDRIFTQWGPPKSLCRHFSRVKRNKLLHSINLSGGRVFSFPHGFEIKDVSLVIGWKARLRSFICDLSFNPFKDYTRYYTRYFFETKFHSTRYRKYMETKKTGVIGFPTFNPYSLARIKNRLKKYGTNPMPIMGKILIMPKFRYIDRERIEIFNDVDYVIPHPREYDDQTDFLIDKYPNIKVLKSLDFFRLGDCTHIIDFGTSVSILGKLFGSKVTYINMLPKKPHFSESDFEKMALSDFFSCGYNTYESYSMYVLSEIMLNKYEQ